jgi:hypothetical protein
MLRGKLTEQMKMQVVAGQKAPFPYESPVFTDAIRHSVWYLPDVASCYAMGALLLRHPYFSDFEIVVAAGSRAGQGPDAKPPVEAAIGKAAKKNKSGSITLSCGKLMTGVTIPEWGAILMLRSLRAPESYFQAAFRVQSPWAFRDGEGNLDVRKSTCYVFEFDPNRALSLLAEYGARLAAQSGETPAEAIGKLLNYLPIFGLGSTHPKFSTGRRRALAQPRSRSSGTHRSWSTSTSAPSRPSSSTRSCWRPSRRLRTSVPWSATPSRSSPRRRS